LMTVFVVCPLLLYHCRHRPYPRFPCFCFALPLAVATPFCSYPLERSLSEASQLPLLGFSSISSLLSSTAMWNSSQCSQELEVSGS
jgi:hypothetical protein